jgi:hypothetical protein
MIVSGVNYRCSNKDCERPLTIKADIVDSKIDREVRDAVSDLCGVASADEQVQQAKADLEIARERRESLVETLADIPGPAAKQKLQEAQHAIEAAQHAYDQIASNQANVIEIDPEADWDELTLDERRALIKARVDSVTVVPAAKGLKGADRITVTLYGFTTPRKGEIQRLRRGLSESVDAAQRVLDHAAQQRV